MRIKTLMLAFTLLFVAGFLVAQDNPFAAFMGSWTMEITKAEPALPDEAMSGTINATMDATPDNNGMMITWSGTTPDGTAFMDKEMWYYDKTTKKIYGLSNEYGRVQRMEGELGADGKSMNFTSTFVSNPKESVKLNVKAMDGEVHFTQTFMADGKQVQYVEGKGTKK